MAVKLTMTFMILIVSLTLVSGTPVERERRFIVDSIMNGAKAVAGGVTGTFSRFFGGQFKVTDTTQTLSDADALRGYGHNLNEQGMWFTQAAESYRKSLYHQDAHAHLDEWKSTATLLTRLADVLLSGNQRFIHTGTWIRIAVVDSANSKKTKENFEGALKIFEEITERLERLIPEVSQALNELKDVAAPETEKDIVETLKKVTKLESLVKNIRDRYDSLVKAVGL